jgi:fumarylacetoacetase
MIEDPKTDFPIENLPYGVFSVGGRDPRVGVAIGQHILDLVALPEFGGLFGAGSLEPLLAAGHGVWSAVRQEVIDLVKSGDPEPHLTPIEKAEMHLPCRIGNYVDFFSSLEHATNAGRILRPGTEPLTPNWRHLPIGYHGRAGSIVVDGTPIRRPRGQRRAPDGPSFGPSTKLDFELEMGFITGQGPELGGSVTTAEAETYIFGLVLVNDWSARDIQAWESQPLGPFLGKSFGTTISPWVVPLAALAPYRAKPPVQNPPPLPYLTPAGQGTNLELTAAINGTTVTRSNLNNLYWTMSQQLAHVTSNGATFTPGDLFASGTVSGSTPESRGCLLELTSNGTEPITLEDGQSRRYLEDGDTVVLSAWAGGVKKPRIGFGSCAGTILAVRL